MVTIDWTKPAPTADTRPADIAEAEHAEALAFNYIALANALRRLDAATTETQRGAALYDVHVARATLRDLGES